MEDLNAVGWHFHFISDDREAGGHMLDLKIASANVSIDQTAGFAMLLPDNEMFNGLDLTIDQSDDIKKVETGEVTAEDNDKIVSFEEKKNSRKDAGLAYWDPSAPAMKSIMEFVSAAVDENSDGYIPVEDRIAVFDMDGTLTCETFFTYYDTCMFISYCLEDYPDKVSEELKEAARELRPGYTAGEELARNFAKAYAGMTVEELYDYAAEFGQKKTSSFNNMRYIDGFYLPMVEIVKYLYENDFTVYVVSGTERTTTRAIVDNSPISDYVTSNHVIGTEFEVKVKGFENVSANADYKYANDDELVFTGGFIQKNLNANKTIWIEREIGKRPVLAFGNSGSDTSMMNYTLDDRNPYPARAYMVVADDDVREWGTQNWEEKSKDYEEQGYVPISMKNDFIEIYPEGITKSEKQFTEIQETEEVKEQQEDDMDSEDEELDDAA
jgi:phosphoserine phosphatase